MWSAALGGESFSDYADLVRRLRRARRDADQRGAVQELLTRGLEKDEPFALCLARGASTSPTILWPRLPQQRRLDVCKSLTLRKAIVRWQPP